MSLSVPGPGTRNTQHRHSPLGSPHWTKTHKQLRCELRTQAMWSGQGKKASGCHSHENLVLPSCVVRAHYFHPPPSLFPLPPPGLPLWLRW